MMKTITAALLLATIFASVALAGHHTKAPPEGTEVFKIDPVHSGVSFKIRHFFTNVPGRFGEFQGEIWMHESDPTKNRAVATIKATSIDTLNSDRDDHLRSDDFFDADHYPEITFVSTNWEPKGENHFVITGDLTMHGQTHPVTLHADHLGFGEGRDGIRMTGFDIKGSLDRRQWGINYGTPVIGTKVEIELNIQAHKAEE